MHTDICGSGYLILKRKNNMTMKYLFVIPGMLFLLSSCSLFQKNEEMKALTKKVDSLSVKVDELATMNKALDEEFTWMENELVRISTENKSKTTAGVPVASDKVAVKEPVDWQCQAITNSGKRCSRPAVEGSKYCWQHKKTYEPDKPENKPAPAGSLQEKPVLK
jgi:hypothetical protein